MQFSLAFDDQNNDNIYPDAIDLEEKTRIAVNTIKQHMLNQWHCVVAYSAGKDSSVTAYLAICALEELIAEGKKVPTLHLMHSDTGYENPIVHNFATEEIKKIRVFADTKNIPVKVWVAKPNLSNDYFVQMIGGRLIASVPGTSRKCQQLLKGSPLQKINRDIIKDIKSKTNEKHPRVCVLIGTRRDESTHRNNAMSKRKENALFAVWNETSHQWTLSPIAEFTQDDIFETIGSVTSGQIKTYSDFVALTQVYRDSAAGECMVNLYANKGETKQSSCSARQGCYICLAVKDDRSMENMLSIEDGRYLFMKPLNQLRSYIMSRHFDMNSRNWLARSIDTDDGTILISPNTYSPDFCLDLLRYALTIDVREIEVSQSMGIAPRFQILSEEAILAIDCLWNRYGYNKSLQACKIYHEIFVEGTRYDLPEHVEQAPRVKIPAAVKVPFMDETFWNLEYGLFDSELALADPDQHCDSDVNLETEFEIDSEGAGLFFEFELENALSQYNKDDSELNPMSGLHYLMRLGVVSINQGGKSRWDMMMRIGNQLWRHRLRPYLNQPEKLISKLTHGELFHHGKV